MYFSYALGVTILVPLFFLVRWFLPDQSDLVVVTLTVLPYLPLTVAVYRYARVLWIYFDRSSASVGG
jgi:hypothetical protein